MPTGAGVAQPGDGCSLQTRPLVLVVRVARVRPNGSLLVRPRLGRSGGGPGSR